MIIPGIPDASLCFSLSHFIALAIVGYYCLGSPSVITQTQSSSCTSTLRQPLHNIPGPFVCTAEDVARQVPLISAQSSKCPGHMPYHRLISAGLACRPLVIVNIGANKGYSLATYANLFAPELAITPSAIYGRIMGKYGDAENGGTVNHPCGACNDCREDHITPRSSRTCVRSGGTIFPATDVPVEIHGFEPIASNIEIIETGLMALYKEATSISGGGQTKLIVHRAAVVGDSKIEVVPFGMCPPGLERCGVEAAGTTGGITTWNHDQVRIEDVKATTVDDMHTKFGIPMDIDLLAIDTEGLDPEVLDGAAGLLASHRISIVEFEYHNQRAWKTRTLESVVEKLGGFGYDCFMMHSGYFLQLTNCWTPAFEFKDWANVMCVSRRNTALLAAAQSLTPAFSSP